VLMLRDQGASVREIAQQLGTSRATVYRALEQQNEDDSAEPKAAGSSILGDSASTSEA